MTDWWASLPPETRPSPGPVWVQSLHFGSVGPPGFMDFVGLNSWDYLNVSRAAGAGECVLFPVVQRAGLVHLVLGCCYFWTAGCTSTLCLFYSRRSTAGRLKMAGRDGRPTRGAFSIPPESLNILFCFVSIARCSSEILWSPFWERLKTLKRSRICWKWIKS